MPANHDLYETTVEVTITRENSSVRKGALGQAVLIVISGARLGHKTLLGDNPLDIGRGSGCGLVLDVDSVSRQHARIEWTPAGHTVKDLGSTNGTYVNEVRIAEHLLRDADRLQIGKVLLKYIAGGNIEAAYHEEIQRLTRFDGLTGVHNKTHFEENLKSAVWSTRTEPRPISLIVFDLDHFKLINDTHGHTAGDAVLRQVADAIGTQVSPDELFARIGGEEFAVLCPGMELGGACEVAERMRRVVEGASCSFENTRIAVTISLGVAERVAGSNETGETLFERADVALYAAKAAGRNSLRF